MASGPITSWQIDGETMGNNGRFCGGGGSKITADGDCSHESKRHLLIERKVMTNLDSTLRSRHYFANKDLLSQSSGFSSSHVWMWGLDYKESWAPKNWCFWTVVLEKTLESPLDSKEIQPVHLKGNQSWMFIGRTDAEAEFQYSGHLLWRINSLEKPWCWERLKVGEGDNRGWDCRMASLTQWTWVWVNSRSLVMGREAWHAVVLRGTKSWARLSD